MTAARWTPSFSLLARPVQASVLLLALLGLALSVLLWPHWRQNPDLSHGLFMPVIFVILLHEARQGTARYLPDFRGSTAVAAVLLAAGLAALAVSGLYAVSLGWSHDVVAFTLTVSFVLLLATGLLVCSADTVRWLPCNWSAWIAIALWLLCAPIPPGTYTRLTMALQLMVSENVLRALHLLGIAAARQGNIIQLAGATVGIEEACSGVRSLVSCVFAGFFFSATLVRRPWPRVWIIVLAVPLALGMNFLRSLGLTLLANSGVAIAGTWHDLTGFAVLGITAALLATIALLLEPRTGSAPASATPTRTVETYPPFVPASSRWPRRLLAVALVLAVALAAGFAVLTRPAPRTSTPAPDLAALLPATADGWHVETSTSLYQFRDTLRTDHLAQRTYSRETEQGVEVVTIYLAYWRPGQASVSLVASHTPDACWPGAGWEALPVAAPRVNLALANRTLAAAEARSFRSGTYPQNVWYWHLFDGRLLAHENPNSPAELLRLAWRYGFRRDGDQLFVRVSSNRDWESIRHAPFIETLFARLQPLGL